MLKAKVVSNRDSVAGFSLIELLIVSGVMITVSFVFGQMLLATQISQKNIDIKSQAQNFASTAKVMLSSVQGCRKAFGITEVTQITNGAPVVTLQTTPGVTPSMNKNAFSDPLPSPPMVLDIPKIKIADQLLNPGSIIGDLKVEGITLTPLNQISGNQYMGDLLFLLRRAGNSSLTGSMSYSEKVTIGFKIMEDPTDANFRVITDCWTAPEQNPELMCAQMGGRWLGQVDNANTGHFMSKGRCTFGAEIFLEMSEAPLGIPVKGESRGDGVGFDGERVASCMYSANTSAQTTVNREYQCPMRSSATSPTNANLCRYDYPSKRWGVWRNSAKNGLGPWLYDCHRGVRVTQVPNYIRTLAWNEPITSAFDDTQQLSSNTIEYFEYANDRNTTPFRCKLKPNEDFYINCNNLSDPRGAAEGRSGACIYVFNGRLNFSQGQRSSYTAYTTSGVTPTMNETNYTGWILVDQPRSLFVKSGSPTITEAQGRPCYEIQIDTSLYSEKTLTTKTDAPDVNFARDQAANIHSCLVEAKSNEVSNGLRFTELICDKTVTSSVYPGEALASVTLTDLEFPSAFTLPSASFLGHPQNPVPNPDQQQLAPTLTTGGCWFVGGRGADNTRVGVTSPPDRVITNHDESLRSNITLASFATGTSKTTPTGTGRGVEGVGRFAANEWIYMTGEMPRGQIRNKETWSLFSLDDYQIRSSAFSSGTSADKQPPALPTIPGIPCNRGIRVSTP